MAQTLAAGRPVLDAYRLPFLGTPDPRFRTCVKISTVLGVIVLAIGLFVPRRAVEVTEIEEVPERFAKLILEEPKAPAAPPKIVALTAPEVVMETKPEDIPKPTPIPQNVGQRRQTPKPVPENRGAAGREKAQKEVAAQLTEVKESLDTVLKDVSSALASNDTGQKTERKSRRRRTRSGREATQMAGVGAGVPTVDVPVNDSAISGSGAQIAIESISELVTSGGSSSTSDRSSDGTAGNSEYRSDSSLLAVVRKYSPGIQFCYDNELKKTPGLGGKLVVSVTVAPSGRVMDASIVRDSVGSAGLTSCALAQIEAWKFPAIPEGTVTFQAPFIFTPPE